MTKRERFASATDHYEVEEKLGEGGMGVTWKVRRGSDGGLFVLKEQRMELLEDWKSLELFQREIEVMRGLSIPGVPRLIDTIEDEAGRCVAYVQELVDGEPLMNLVQGASPISNARFEGYLRQVLEIVDKLSNNVPPVVHRDITPRNILVCGERAWLIDFGAVKSSLRESTVMTSVGTFGYMAPEQTLGKAGATSDLYSVGMSFVALALRAEPDKLDVNPATGQVDVESAIKALPKKLQRVLLALTRPGVAQRVGSAREALAILDARAPWWSEVARRPGLRRGVVAAAAVSALVFGAPWLLSLSAPEGGARLGGWFTGHGKPLPAWSMAVLGQPRLFQVPNAVEDLAFSPDGERLVSFSREDMVQWRVQSGAQICQGALEKGYESGSAARWSADQREIWWSVFDSRLYAYHAETCKPARRLPELHARVKGVSSRVDEAIITRSAEGRLVNLVAHPGELVAVEVSDESSKLLRRWPVGGRVVAMATSGDGLTVAVLAKTSGPTFALKTWRLDQGRAGTSFTFPADSHINGVAINHDGSMVAALDQHRIVVFDPHNPKSPRILDVGRHTYDFLHRSALTFSPDGQKLAVAVESEVIVLNPSNNVVLHELRGHAAPVRALAFSPNGERLASGSEDQTIVLWDIP